MPADHFEEIKNSVLSHIQSIFEEMEKEMSISHHEKYTLLEDAFESASDEDELRVAFEQWYGEYEDELGLNYDADELWDLATGSGRPKHKSDEDDEDDLRIAGNLDEEEEEEFDDSYAKY